MRPHGVFTVLVLQLWAVSAATVPPPTNLSLTCEDVKTTLSWEYEHDQTQTSFMVNISSSAGDYATETTEHRYDLTPFVWKTVEHFTGVHSVTVTAVRGGRRSQPAKSKSFSFVCGQSVDLKCNLTFPPVSLTKGEATNVVSFQNPLNFYKELKQTLKNQKVVFEYEVSGNLSKCRQTEKICRYDSTEECVTLEGRLNDGTEVRYVIFNKTEQICISNSSDMQMMTFVILLCFFLVVVTSISVFIYQTRAWTLSEKLKVPPTLIFPDGKVQLAHFTPQEERTNELNIEDMAPLVPMNDRAESDHSGAESDHSGAESDHSGAESDQNYTDGQILEEMGGGFEEGQDGPAEEDRDQLCSNYLSR